MQKSIIKKQAKDKLEQLKEKLREINLDTQHNRDDIALLQQHLQEALRVINVYEYFLTQNEIAPDLNVHLKIMEESDKKALKEERIEIPAEEKKQEKTKKEIVEPVTKVETPEPPKETRIEISKSKSAEKKVEISINDKFRMINELFNHSQQEYNIVVQQLNEVKSLDEAKIYIDGLISVYNWDEEKEIVHILKRIAQKRFL